MQKILTLLLLLLTFGVQIVFAQGQTVTGKVISREDGNPLPGVSVLVKGTSTGTSTQADGSYSITAPANATLVFSFIGMNTLEIPVGNKSNIDAQLTPNTAQLNEVVVVGYGTQKKTDVTGSIATVSAKDIENQPVNSFEASLQGRTPGVYINSGGGKLGQGINIRVRGAASVSASNQPLYVIDGIPVTSASIGDPNAEPTNPMADINPNDIESIDILKDAAAAAIYGSRASNGVVLITTKKGKVGKTKVELGYFTGVSTPTNLREFLNAAQYKELFTEAATNEGYDPAEEFELEGLLDINSPYDTDWNDEAFQRGSMTQYTVSATGGDAKTRFYISGTQNDQKGIIVGNEFKRTTARINLDHSVNTKFKIGTNISLIRSINNRIADDNEFSNPVQLNALSPLEPLRDPTTGKLNSDMLYYNALIDLENASNVATTYRTVSSLFGSYEIKPYLVFRSEYGLDLLSLEEERYNGRETLDGGPAGLGSYRYSRSLNYTTNNTLTFNKELNDQHSLEALLGMSFQEANISGNFVQGQGFPNDNYRKLVSSAKLIGGSSTETGYSFLSYFSRANYKFKNRYLLSASARIDGSSRFGENNRYGFFPAGSLGWIISEEDFLPNKKAVSFLKLRSSIGVTGNSEIGNFQSRGLYGASFYADQAGIVPVSLPSPDLRWEKTTQFDVGLDYGFLNDRISGEIDFYLKNTKDLLLDLPLSATNGFTSITRNIGTLKNTGIEFVINTENIHTVNGFIWRTSFNISRNVNKVVNMNGAEINGGGRTIGRIAEGEPLGYFYAPKYAGVDPANGDAIYYTLTGETTNDVSEAERQKVGDPNPDFISGLENRFSYKGLELSVLLQGVYGNDIYNIAGLFQSVNGDYFDNQTVDQMARWQKPGDKTNVPQARLYAGNGTEVSSRWVQDGSFLRVKNVNLGYNLPTSLVNKARVTSARVYVAAQNLFTFTKYTGYDPEVNNTNFGGTNVNIGHDFYTPPQARTITVGINIGF